MTHRRPSPAVISLLALPLAGVLAACGTESDGDSPPISPETVSTSPAPAPPASDGQASDLLTAADTALSEIRRGTLFSIERDDSGWTASVLDQDGTQNEIEVSADGSTVARGPIPEQDDIQTRTEQRAFARNISVDYEAALAAAQDAADSGLVSAVTLDVSDGIINWTVTFDEGTADARTAIVNAGTGEVLDVETEG